MEKKQADLVVPVKVTNRAKGLACNVVATIFGFMLKAEDIVERLFCRFWTNILKIVTTSISPVG